MAEVKAWVWSGNAAKLLADNILVGATTVSATELGYLSGVTSAIQTQLNGKEPTINLTINRAVISDGSGGLTVSATTATEVGYLSGVTSAIQTQLDGKEPTISLTGNRAVVSDAGGALTVSSATDTEVGYLSGVTSAIQTQIDSKTGIADNETITGTWIFNNFITISAASNQLVLSSGVNQLTLNSGTSAAARTYTVPDVGTSAEFVMTAGAQTIAGAKTFSDNLIISRFSSDSQLKLERTGTATATGWIWANSDKIRFGDDSGGAPNNTRMCIETATGNVGIGTTSPSQTLEIGAGGNLLLPNDGNLYFKTSGGATAQILSLNASNYVEIGDSITSSNLMVLRSGNVGIGDTAPHTKLTIQKSSSAGTVADTPSIVLSNRNNTNATFVHSGIFADTYRDIANPHYSAGVWFTRNPYVGNLSSGSDIIFGTRASNTAGTLPTERMRIDSSGNLLVGATSAAAKCHIKGSGSTSGTNGLVVQNSLAYNIMFTRDDGFLSSPAIYDKTNAAAANVVVGNGGYLYRSTSSLRYKTDVQSATHGLNELMQLRSVTYRSTADQADGDSNKKIFGGLIAEEVDAAGLSEFVQYDEQGQPDALHYGHMVSLCIKAIQELNAKVEALTPPA